ncbi:MAG: polysulfide reductase NrfD [Steroidobacteraceae bacterium]|nr:polysulfide reductase NrfD [Steroidobacteraceae bacterium]
MASLAGGARPVSGQDALARTLDDLAGPALGRPLRCWWVCFGLALAALAVGAGAVAYTLGTGIGTWGLNRSVGWAYDITNFVFWIGVGHAGTLISAVLLLFRQRWRSGVNRSAEMMTITAIVCAAVFPVIHLGRPWLFFWVFPLPNTRGPLWINFSSPLTWDVFAIATYFLVSVLFWYLGLLPDLAILRDAAAGWRRRAFGFLSLGWNGSQRTWARYERTCLLLAGLATALVVSVHSVVSFDFATSVVPGWHTTIFPPYFVVGAIFSGMAMVLALLIVMRRALALEAYVTPHQLDALCRIMLATSCLLGLAYLVEVLTALYADHRPDRFMVMVRMEGPLAAWYWLMIACNVLVPQLLWSSAVRRNLAVVFAISVAALAGMWLERFVIIVGSLQRDFLPSNWVGYLPTRIEVATLVGSVGLFLTLFLLFCRWLPVVSISETRALAARSANPGVTGE